MSLRSLNREIQSKKTSASSPVSSILTFVVPTVTPPKLRALGARELRRQQRQHSRQADHVCPKDAARQLALHLRRVAPSAQPPRLAEDTRRGEADTEKSRRNRCDAHPERLVAPYYLR